MVPRAIWLQIDPLIRYPSDSESKDLILIRWVPRVSNQLHLVMQKTVFSDVLKKGSRVPRKI